MEILTSKRVKHQIIKIVGDLFPFNQLTASLLWPHLSQSESSSDVWDSLKFVVTWCIFIQACCLHQWLSRQKVIQNQRHFCPIFNFLIFFFRQNWCSLITSCRKHEADGLVFGIHLICKGLRWIVDDDGLWQISAQDVEVFDVVSLDTNTMLTKQPVSKVTVGEWDDRGMREREKNQSVTWSEQSIIQKNHNTDTSTATHANTHATYSFLTPCHSASEFVM